jgi:hypothetical protein
MSDEQLTDRLVRALGALSCSGCAPGKHAAVGTKRNGPHARAEVVSDAA